MDMLPGSLTLKQQRRNERKHHPKAAVPINLSNNLDLLGAETKQEKKQNRALTFLRSTQSPQ